MTRSLKIFLIVLGIVLFSLALRWNSFTAPFERDEGEYAYSARLLLTDHVPYQESFLQKPPPIIYTYALAQLLSPRGIWLPRVLALLFSIGTILLTGLIAWREYGRQVAVITMFFLTPLLASPYLASLAANTEIFMLLPLMGVVAIYALSKKNDIWWRYLMAGILTSLAILYKPIAAFPLFFLFAVWFWEIAVVKKNLKGLVRFGLLVGGGGLLGSILVLGYFIWRGAWSAFWEEAIQFNGYYLAQYGFGLANLWSRVQALWSNWWVLFLLLGYFIYRRPARWWLYLGLLVTSLAAVYQSPIGHYYLLIMPFWAIMVASSVVSLSKTIVLQARKWPPVATWRFDVLLPVVVLFLILIPVREQFAKTPDELSAWIYGLGNPFLESQIVADKLASVTKPHDKVFIGGSEPQLLYLANRLSDSRFVITYPLIIDTPKRLEYQKEAVQEIQKNLPAAVVVSLRDESGLWNQDSPRVFIDYLTTLLNKNYQMIGGFVWSSRGGQWQDTLTKEDVSAGSLLLFKKT